MSTKARQVHPAELAPLGHTKTGSAKLYALLARLNGTRRAGIVIDEAGYMADGSDRERAAIMRDLSWLGEHTKTPIFLLGTYDGLPLLSTTEDVNARVRFVHLGRYRDTARDRSGFYTGLKNLDAELRRLRVADDAFRLQHDPATIRYIYRTTHGRFGLVILWANLASVIAREHDRALRLADLKKAQRFLLGNALTFQAKTRTDEQAALRIIRAALGAAGDDQDDPPSAEAGPRPAPTGPRPRVVRVGERKQSRDPAFTAVPLRSRRSA